MATRQPERATHDIGVPAPDPARPDRRVFLKTAGVAAGLLLSGGAAHLLHRPRRDRSLRQALVALSESLSPAQRRAICLDWDHPARQLLGHVACLDVPRVHAVLTAEQKLVVHELYDAMVSDGYRRRFGRLVGLEGGGLDPCALAIFGDPRSEDSEVVLSGGHLLIRGGGITRGGSAFGGPLGYGHQIGNGSPRLPGNAFAYHGDAANTLFAALGSEEQERAVVGDEPPFETVVQLQGRGGAFTGLAVAGLADARKQDVQDLVETVLSCYADADRAQALACVRRNGGVEALHLSYYASRGFYDDGRAWTDLDADERGRRGLPYWHVWRIEGPGSVLHFRGWPHVHAAIHIADHEGADQNVGEVLAIATTTIEGEALRRLTAEALRAETGADCGILPRDVPARFYPGPVTTGLVWSLDPYQDEVVVAEVRGDKAAAPLRDALSAQGLPYEPDRVYRVASSGFGAHYEDLVGAAERFEATGVGLRAAYERYFRRHGLERAAQT